MLSAQVRNEMFDHSPSVTHLVNAQGTNCTAISSQAPAQKRFRALQSGQAICWPSGVAQLWVSAWLWVTARLLVDASLWLSRTTDVFSCAELMEAGEITQRAATSRLCRINPSLGSANAAHCETLSPATGMEAWML